MSNPVHRSTRSRRTLACIAAAALIGASIGALGLLAGTTQAASAVPAPIGTLAPTPAPSSSAPPVQHAVSIDVWTWNWRVIADGSATTKIEAFVGEVDGTAVPGLEVAFSSSDPGQRVGEVEDEGDGYYSAWLTTSTTAGVSIITANVVGAVPPLSNTVDFTQSVGQVDEVRVVIAPSTILADGVSITTATATVSDAHGNPRSGDALTFSSTDPGHRFGELVDHEDGTYSVVITSSRTVGTSTITFTDPYSSEPEPSLAASAADAADAEAGSVSGAADLLQVLPSSMPSTAPPAAAVHGGTLSATGADVGQLPFGALIGLLLGSALLVVRRRSSRA